MTENNNNQSRYEVIKNIGHGGMATVYLAHDRILNRNVALKLLNPEAVTKDSSALKRFLIEAHATTSLIHPNIVEVYDICDIGDKHFIVMEYVEGNSLKDNIKLRGRIPYKEAVWIMKQLCSGIMEAHRNNIIHRDIKPQNILVKNDGTCKIADFGIAVLNNSFELTSKDTVLGSVHYLAPELSKGDSPSMQSDIYSLGIVFFELITGQVPYSGDSAVSIALKHFKEPLPDIHKFIPDVPQSIVNIITKATAKDTKERYENVALMLKDLNECLEENHNNDKPVILNKMKLDQHKEMFSKSKTTKNTSYKKSNKKFDLEAFFLIIISICSVVCIIFTLVVTGFINFGSNGDVAIPDIVNMNLNDANDFLLDYGISIDTTNIQREMSDDVEENVILRTIPEVGSKIDKGSRISVVVSSGSMAVLDNYVGKNIAEVEKAVLDTKISIIKNPVEGDGEPGSIVNQVPSSGTKYDPNEYFEVTVDYIPTKSFTLDHSIKGRYIEDVYYELSSQGLKVEKVEISKDTLDEGTLYSTSAYTVLYTEPALGTIYTQENDNILKLYYYGE